MPIQRVTTTSNTTKPKTTTRTMLIPFQEADEGLVLTTITSATRAFHRSPFPTLSSGARARTRTSTSLASDVPWHPLELECAKGEVVDADVLVEGRGREEESFHHR